MKNNKQHGFTLLEVLVAFTMLAVTFATVMQIIAGSSRNTVKASQNTKIALLSQSKLDELGLFEKLEEGSTSGDFDDDTSWVLEIVPYEVPYEGDFNQDFSAIDLMDVTLIVTSEIGNRQIINEFHTLRAVTPDFSTRR
ncbi:MAG: prepilin-type N-terminal cleavage/methylation domain-containing protein [Alcanivoracaceae bacterium]|nr:prepilin-type N-terminal cleavage/methylation domain-containing protein [Alcanivoracaceae bacterium]